MTEQERGKETPTQFPMVPKELVENIWRSVHKQDFISKTARTMINKDPVLLVALNEMIKSELVTDPASFIEGARSIYAAFIELQKQGVSLAPVSQGVVETFLMEWAGVFPDFKSKISNKKAVEFNFPTPFKYCEENPALMVFIATHFKDIPFTQGAMFVYELKRRQFHADQLTKKFGG